MVVEERFEGDVLMIDVERLIAADELRKQAVAVEQVRDAGSKWLTQYPEAKMKLNSWLLASCWL